MPHLFLKFRYFLNCFDTRELFFIDSILGFFHEKKKQKQMQGRNTLLSRGTCIMAIVIRAITGKADSTWRTVYSALHVRDLHIESNSIHVLVYTTDRFDCMQVLHDIFILYY